jgi:hemerythrin-like domain-containing protein
MMAQVHNSFIRALNAIYHLAPKVPHDDLANFVDYSLAIVKGLDFHHEEEETAVFPEVEKVTGVKGLMEANVRQHEAFHGGLVAFKRYLEGLKENGVERLRTTQFRELFNAFAQPLQEHLEAEITTIVDLRRYADTGIDLMKLADAAAQKSVTPQFMVDMLPGMLLNHDRTYEGGFEPGLWPPGIPWVLGWFVRKVGTCWYWGRWKFACCDYEQRPRELPYMQLEDRIEE